MPLGFDSVQICKEVPTGRKTLLPVSSGYKGLFRPEDGGNETTGRDVDVQSEARIMEEFASALKQKIIFYWY